MKAMLVTVVAVAALALAGAAAADQTYTDAAGEVAGSADITTVAISNDATAGSLSFAVGTNMPTLEANSEIDIVVDSDQNASTGGLGIGADYLFGLDTGGWFFAKWDGSTFSAVPAVTDLFVTFSNGNLGIKMAAADLGSPTAFNFGVLTFRGPDPANPFVDQAPDNGLWSYTMAAAPPPPPPPPPPAPAPVTIDSVSAAYAGVPTHGKTFKVTSLKVDLSNGVETKASALKCAATLGGKHLAGTGTGGCTFHLPATAKGKKLSVKASGKYKSTTVSKTVAFKVK